MLDTWRRCRHTRAGWTGVNEKGQRVNISYRPEECAYGPARMPDKDYVVIVRNAASHEYGDVHGHVPEGVVLIERAGRKAS